MKKENTSGKISRRSFVIGGAYNVAKAAAKITTFGLPAILHGCKKQANWNRVDISSMSKFKRDRVLDYLTSQLGSNNVYYHKDSLGVARLIVDPKDDQIVHAPFGSQEITSRKDLENSLGEGAYQRFNVTSSVSRDSHERGIVGDVYECRKGVSDFDYISEIKGKRLASEAVRFSVDIMMKKEEDAGDAPDCDAPSGDAPGGPTGGPGVGGIS
jgi:hypothetical protein